MKQKPTFVNIIVLTLVTVFIWIGYSIYASLSRPISTEVPQEALENFDPTLDAEAVSKLQQSIYLGEDEIVASTPQPEEEIEEVLEEEVIEEESPTPTATPANEETQP